MIRKYINKRTKSLVNKLEKKENREAFYREDFWYIIIHFSLVELLILYHYIKKYYRENPK